MDHTAAASPKREVPEDTNRSPPVKGSKEARHNTVEMMPAAVPETPAMMDTEMGDVQHRPGITSPADSKKARNIGGLAVNATSFFILAALTINAVVGAPVYGALSGELLDPDLVKAGRRRERELMEQFDVFERAPADQARGKRVRSKWVEDYKLENGKRIARSRLVAMEIAWDARFDTFAGTPPLKAVRLGLALAAFIGPD